jgi:hypothetical protein
MTKRARPEIGCSAVIHTHGGPAKDVHMALLEQAFETKRKIEGLARAKASMARFLAARLRDPDPSREILDTVARMLDGNDVFRLVLDQRSSGERYTKRVNDGAIAKALRQEIAAGKPKYGMMQRVAKGLGVGPDKVRQVHAQIVKSDMT